MAQFRPGLSFSQEFWAPRLDVELHVYCSCYRGGQISLCAEYGWIVSASAQNHHLIKARAWKELALSLGNKTRKHIYQTKPLFPSSITLWKDRKRYNYQAHLIIKHLRRENAHKILDNVTLAQANFHSEWLLSCLDGNILV